MKFRTITNISKSCISISHQSKILMLGSCFTNSIGQKLKDNKFNILLNPFGTLYNPTSIATAINWLKGNGQLKEEKLFLHNGLYHSFYHHGLFSNTDKQKALCNINEELKNGQKFFKTVDVVFVTFGTAYVFEHIESKKIVANCHKVPASHFNRYKLSVESIVDQWTEIITDLTSRNKNLNIIFTVSPIRHLRDGAHDNQLSKSTLLLAIERLNNQFKNTHYFPSYEIVLDDLRDYRFYEEDMCHPNKIAIDYIWEIFGDVYFSTQTSQVIEEWTKLNQAINHRPINPDCEEHIHFLNQTMLKLENFQDKHPYICLDRELEKNGIRH